MGNVLNLIPMPNPMPNPIPTNPIIYNINLKKFTLDQISSYSTIAIIGRVIKQ